MNHPITRPYRRLSHRRQEGVKLRGRSNRHCSIPKSLAESFVDFISETGSGVVSIPFLSWGHLLFQWLSRIHEWATRNPVMRVDDPVLGELNYSESSWECRLNAAVGPIVLRIGGRYEPDPQLIATARDTAHRIEQIYSDAKAYLKTESEQPHWTPFADEINSLRIQDISYWWPKKPKSGMIFFEGPDECRLWHCDIDDGRLFGLVFDS